MIWCGALLMLWALAACGGPSASATPPITLYTCVNDTTIQPVLKEFQAAHPGAHVELFRAPTGQLNARVASDARSGGLKADVIWACDPLTMQDYVTQGLVGGWTPETEIPATRTHTGLRRDCHALHGGDHPEGCEAAGLLA